MPLSAQKGLANHAGNLCYRLSLLQALLHLPIFVNWALEHLDPAHCENNPLKDTYQFLNWCTIGVADNQEECFSCSLRLLTQEYWSGARRSRELTTVLLRMDKLLKKCEYTRSLGTIKVLTI